MSSPKQNTFIFAFLMIITQIIISVMHALFIRTEPQVSDSLDYSLMSFNLLIPFLLAFLTIAGFGLIFSYNKMLIKSGLGFTFFITAFVIEYYPLINAFWTKTQIMSISTTNFSDSSDTYPFYLTRASNISTSSSNYFNNL